MTPPGSPNRTKARRPSRRFTDFLIADLLDPVGGPLQYLQLPVNFGALLRSLQILVIDLPKCPPYGSARSTVNSTIRKSPARTAAGS